MPRSRSTASPAPASMSTAGSRSSTPSSRAPDAGPTQPQGADDAGGAISARLARGALRPRRRPPLLPLPEGSARLGLVAHARLGDADGVPGPARHGRDPGDVLQTGPEPGVRVGPPH